MNIKHTLCVLASVTLLTACNGSTPDVGSEHDQQTQTLEKFNVSVTLNDVEMTELHQIEFTPIIEQDDRIQGYSWKQLGENPQVKLKLEDSDKPKVKIAAPELTNGATFVAQLQLTVRGPRDSEVKKKVNVTVKPIPSVKIAKSPTTTTYLNLATGETFLEGSEGASDKDWNLAFLGDDILLNSGVYGDGNTQIGLLKKAPENPKTAFVETKASDFEGVKFREEDYAPILTLENLQTEDWWMMYGNTNYTYGPDLESDKLAPQITNLTSGKLDSGVGIHIPDLSGKDIGQLEVIKALITEKTELPPNLTIFRISSYNPENKTIVFESKSQIFYAEDAQPFGTPYINLLNNFLGDSISVAEEILTDKSQLIPFHRLNSKFLTISIPERDGERTCVSLAYNKILPCVSANNVQPDLRYDALKKLDIEIPNFSTLKRFINENQELANSFGWDLQLENVDGTLRIWLSTGGSWLANKIALYEGNNSLDGGILSSKLFQFGTPKGNASVRVIGPIDIQQDEYSDQYLKIWKQKMEVDKFTYGELPKMTSDSFGILKELPYFHPTNDNVQKANFNIYGLKDKNLKYKFQITSSSITDAVLRFQTVRN